MERAGEKKRKTCFEAAVIHQMLGPFISRLAAGGKLRLLIKFNKAWLYVRINGMSERGEREARGWRGGVDVGGFVGIQSCHHYLRPGW